jgi:hypothetical protein
MGKTKVSRIPSNGRLTSSMSAGLDSLLRARDGMLLQMNNAIVLANKQAEDFLVQCTKELGLDMKKTWRFDTPTRTFREVEKQDG